MTVSPMARLACNPLSFLGLFSHSVRPPVLKVRAPAHAKQLGWYVEFVFRVTTQATMTKLVLAVFCQSVGEVRFAFDIAFLVWRQVHGFTAAKTG